MIFTHRFRTTLLRAARCVLVVAVVAPVLTFVAACSSESNDNGEVRDDCCSPCQLAAVELRCTGAPMECSTVGVVCGTGATCTACGAEMGTVPCNEYVECRRQRYREDIGEEPPADYPFVYEG